MSNLLAKINEVVPSDDRWVWYIEDEKDNKYMVLSVGYDTAGRDCIYMSRKILQRSVEGENAEDMIVKIFKIFVREIKAKIELRLVNDILQITEDLNTNIMNREHKMAKIRDNLELAKVMIKHINGWDQE